jgi:hypothetical protein
MIFFMLLPSTKGLSEGFSEMFLLSSRKAELRAGKQMQVESAKSRLRGRPESFVGNGLKPFSTIYIATGLPHALKR